jgi:hypothetical protein
LKQLPTISLVLRTVLSVAVPNRGNHTRAIERELNFLIRMQLNISLCVYRLDRNKREILPVSLNNCPIWRKAKADRNAGSRENALGHIATAANTYNL